jgi:preprotein translocase subunit SecG
MVVVVVIAATAAVAVVVVVVVVMQTNETESKLQAFSLEANYAHQQPPLVSKVTANLCG